MRKTGFFTSILALTLLAALLAACGLIGGTGGQPVTVDDVGTMSAATVSSRLTQIAISTLIAQITPMTQATATSVQNFPTQTPWVITQAPTIVINTPIPPTNTPVPIPCNLVGFVSDVTVKDGTSFLAGEAFTKTWKVKNNGSCTWTMDYTLYFYGGTAMGAPAAVTLPRTVKPGETVNVSVNMVAPSLPGEYTGRWLFKTDKGSVFGLPGNDVLTVVIKVAALPTPKDTALIYDFVGNMCKAQWRTNGGFINCPSNALDTTLGSITRSYAPILPGGARDDEGALVTVPAKGGDGMIQGQFPKMLMHSGDHFKATLFCQDKAAACDVTYQLSYKDANSSDTAVLGTWTRKLADGILSVDVDLSTLDGKEAIFFLKVISGGDSKDDLANWMAARISHN